MRKWFKYIVLTTIMLFVGLKGVSAKMCEYTQTGSGLVSNNDAYLNVKVTFNDSGKPSAVIYGYKDKDIKNGNKESIKNWDKTLQEAYDSTGKCPTYVVVKKITGYGVYLNYNFDTAQKHCTLEAKGTANYGKNCVIASSKESNSSDDNSHKKKCQELVADYTKIAEQQSSTNFTTKECRDTDGKKYTAYAECTALAKSMLSVIREHDKEIQSCISSGYISKSDDDVKKYTSTFNEAESNLESFQKEVEKERDTYIDTGEVIEKDETVEALTGCDDMPETTKLLKQVYTLLKYLIPVLIIGLSIIDFIKVVASGEDKVFKEVWTKFVKRLIIGIIILILPQLLSMLIKMSGITKMYGGNGGLDFFCIFE